MTLVQFWKNWHGRRVCSLSPGCSFIKKLHTQKCYTYTMLKIKFYHTSKKDHPKNQPLQLCLVLINLEIFFYMVSKYCT